jgi:hypothetical protein
MAAPKRSKIQRQKDRATIANLYLQGWTQQKIAEYLELNQSNVSRELTKIKLAWKAEATRDFDLHLTEQLRRLAMVEGEYWEAWQRSQQPKEQSLQEKLSEVATNGDSRTKVQRKTEARIGDPRFLEGLVRCHQERSKLLSLYPATNTPIADSNAVAPGLSPDAVQLIRSQILGVSLTDDATT